MQRQNINGGKVGKCNNNGSNIAKEVAQVGKGS